MFRMFGKVGKVGGKTEKTFDSLHFVRHFMCTTAQDQQKKRNQPTAITSSETSSPDPLKNTKFAPFFGVSAKLCRNENKHCKRFKIIL